jgi:hypothetical protein
MAGSIMAMVAVLLLLSCCSTHEHWLDCGSAVERPAPLDDM